ncbi:hypothetical protein EDD68_10513 [Melghiribacillus thermohalophilus]|uniref:Phr family secreted Rap phosphatase inhibitor n=1 Tax=Melghiribacillus thermohalophilus TaxID=1324956 RepID=A0A4R3N7X4_9BACI|nr:hypothetical protein [Melghiribacillus thermohalophilus]TCT24561.1 hypothetical protein EDD68_10513 [Melghiribacillus thermohalophilus]
MKKLIATLLVCAGFLLVSGTFIVAGDDSDYPDNKIGSADIWLAGDDSDYPDNKIGSAEILLAGDDSDYPDNKIG